jgi:hypothetical protein
MKIWSLKLLKFFWYLLMNFKFISILLNSFFCSQYFFNFKPPEKSINFFVYFRSWFAAYLICLVMHKISECERKLREIKGGNVCLCRWRLNIRRRKKKEMLSWTVYNIPYHKKIFCIWFIWNWSFDFFHNPPPLPVLFLSFWERNPSRWYVITVLKMLKQWAIKLRRNGMKFKWNRSSFLNGNWILHPKCSKMLRSRFVLSQHYWPFNGKYTWGAALFKP